MVMEDLLQQALGHHRAGRLVEAERLYRTILGLESADALALALANYFLGMMAIQIGEPAWGLPHFQAAITAKSDLPEFHVGLNSALLHLGLFDEARAALSRAAAVLPGNPVILREIQERDSAPFFPNIQGRHAPERQVYMSALIHMLRDGSAPLSILEIGTFMGGSLYTWAKAVERLTDRHAGIWCVDPWEMADGSQYSGGKDGGMKSLLSDGVAHRVFRNTLKFLPSRIKVTELRGLSHQVLPGLAGRAFDVIYIDGCHLHPDVLEDIRACDGLLAEGGFMCGDDLEAQLTEVDAMAALANARVDYVTDPFSGHSFHPGVTLGVGTYFGPVSVYRGFWAMRKRRDGYEPVSMEGATGLLPYHWPPEDRERARTGVLKDGLLGEVL